MRCFGRKRCSAPTVACHIANVGGHAIPELCSPTRGLSQRDNCHACAAYALLRRRERLRVGASAGMASPPTLLPMCCFGRKRCSAPTVACHIANVGGHASQRDTCHACAAYALLRRWEASPPTLLPMRCFGRKRCSAPMVAYLLGSPERRGVQSSYILLKQMKSFLKVSFEKLF